MVNLALDSLMSAELVSLLQAYPVVVSSSQCLVSLVVVSQLDVITSY